MSILPEIDDLELRPGETVVREWLGTHEQTHLLVTRVHKPGKIVLTNQRLAFQPQKMGLAIHALGVVGGTPVAIGDPWSTELEDVAGVTDLGRTKCLTVDGRSFVVDRRFGMDAESFFASTGVQEVVEEIRAAAANAPPAPAGLREKWSIGANSVQAGTAVGGRLSLVGTSLVFLPNGVEKAIDSLVGSPFAPVLSLLGRTAPTEAREIPLSDLAAVEVVEGRLSLDAALAGGLRDRLLLRTKDGREEIFVVSDVESSMKRLGACLPAGAAPPARG